MLRTIRSAAILVAASLPCAFVAAHASNAAPVGGSIVVSVPTNDPTQASIGARPVVTNGYDPVGTVTGTIANTDIDPTSCQVSGMPGTTGAGAGRLVVSGCADSDLHVDAALTDGAAAIGADGTVGHDGTTSSPLRLRIRFYLEEGHLIIDIRW